MLTKHELKLISEFLYKLSEHQGNAGSNDYELPNTYENRKMLFLAEFLNTNGNYSVDWSFHNLEDVGGKGKLNVSDFVITGYLQSRIAEELGEK